MAGKLYILSCQGFRPEIEAVIAAAGWTDVATVFFPVRCGHPPLKWQELRPLLPEDCTHVLLIGGVCLHELGEPPSGTPPVQLFPLEECFHLVAPPALVNEAIARGSYLMTPGWLADWRKNLRKLGFEEADAAEFFRDCSQDMVLLDTGVMADMTDKLAELAVAVGLPASRVALGLDYARLLLSLLVTEWHLDEERLRAQQCEQNASHEHADNMAAMDFMGRVALLKSEEETVAAIEELFHMLFAPEEFYYVHCEDGIARNGNMPRQVLIQAQRLAADWAWTGSGKGFLLRITHSGTVLGIVVADRFAFPEYRERYLDLARSIAGVCGLAIENARIYRKIKAAEESLRKSEHSLKMAQAIAHVGHWEWNIHTAEMRWSDEIYRILGLEPQKLAPSHDNYFRAVHPDDRARVNDQIGTLREGESCNCEYRVVLPDGQVRTVHSVIEIVTLDGEDKPTMIGTLRDITSREVEMLGVVQDISERKELEMQLAQEAHTDALTGCANRRYFLGLASQQLAHVHRYGGEMSVLMIDLDHFKTVNDRYGHQIGDQALQKLVQICGRNLRDVDVIGRLGGEEFAILLPETGLLKAHEAAERLRHEVAEATLPLEDKAPLKFTISIGVATIAPEESFESALDRADQALYKAKNTGRNRVMVADDVARPQK